jgi:hypothetical protein
MTLLGRDPTAFIVKNGRNLDGIRIAVDDRFFWDDCAAGIAETVKDARRESPDRTGLTLEPVRGGRVSHRSCSREPLEPVRDLPLLERSRMRRIASPFRTLPGLWISRSGSAVTIDLPSPSCHRRISWRREGDSGDAVNIADWLRGLGLEKYAPAFDENAIN